MHILIGALGSIVTILWILHRLADMGIDLGGLNPWLWKRRRNWRKKYEGNPIFTIESPLEVTALLLAATAKLDGDMSVEEKSEILTIFDQVFGLSTKDAAALMVSTTHLLGNGDEMRNKLADVLKPSEANFSPSQAASAIDLMKRVAAISDVSQNLKSEFVAEAAERLTRPHQPKGEWE